MTKEQILKDKIKDILTPPNPPEARFHGGVKDWEYKYNKTGLDYLVNRFIELFDQILQEEREEIETKLRNLKRTIRKDTYYKSVFIRIFQVLNLKNFRYNNNGKLCRIKKI